MEYKSHNEVVEASKAAAHKWRLVPAPQRGEVIRQFGNELRNQKAELAKVITTEARKIKSCELRLTNNQSTIINL